MKKKLILTFVFMSVALNAQDSSNESQKRFLGAFNGVGVAVIGSLSQAAITVGSAVLTYCSSSSVSPAICAGTADSIIHNYLNNPDRDRLQTLRDQAFVAFATKEAIRSIALNRCGCSLKSKNPEDLIGELPEFQPYRDFGNNEPMTGFSSLLKQSPNFYNNVLLGDSITALGRTQGAVFSWNKTYAPGWGIVNGGLSGATSDDLSSWLDSCASQNTSLWNPEPLQEPCEKQPKGRFSCNPPPNSDKSKGFVQFQNRNVYLMIGGNDFNVDLYKSLLQTFPVLVQFRHAHIANQINKILTYIERQSGTRKTLIGYMPLPSYYPGETIEVFEPFDKLLLRLGLPSRYDHWFQLLPDGRSVVKANYQDLPGGRTIAATQTMLTSFLDQQFLGQSFTISNIIECFKDLRIDLDRRKANFCSRFRDDNSWLSQRLLEINLTMQTVASYRKTGMYTLYHSFVDQKALSKGYYYVGNKLFWSLEHKYDAGQNAIHNYFTDGRNPLDSIHPNHLGYLAYGATLDTVFKHEKANIKQTPFGYRDGCFVEPNDPGPYEECKSKMFHEWESGRCVDRTPQPPPPIVVENPIPPIDHRPVDVPPPIHTIEPPPAPAASDNTLILLVACFWFGFCRL